jgi:hypothetical protein
MSGQSESRCHSNPDWAPRNNDHWIPCRRSPQTNRFLVPMQSYARFWVLCRSTQKYGLKRRCVGPKQITQPSTTPLLNPWEESLVNSRQCMNIPRNRSQFENYLVTFNVFAAPTQILHLIVCAGTES